MNFAPAQKAQFRQDVKEALTSLELIASQAGLDQFDQELMLEVIRCNGHVSNLIRTVLHSITHDDESSTIDTETALIQEEYHSAE